MVLYRCAACDPLADPHDRDGALWIPQEFQGAGRHDNPDQYGVLYLTETAVAGVVEQLARFRGTKFLPSMLRRRGLPIVLVHVELDDATADALIDLDDPLILTRESLRPSLVATRERSVTQPAALELWHAHQDAAGLRWWSTFEASWGNVSLFDRAAEHITGVIVVELEASHPTVVEARDLLGL